MSITLLETCNYPKSPIITNNKQIIVHHHYKSSLLEIDTNITINDFKKYLYDKMWYSHNKSSGGIWATQYCYYNRYIIDNSYSDYPRNDIMLSGIIHKTENPCFYNCKGEPVRKDTYEFINTYLRDSEDKMYLLIEKYKNFTIKCPI
tara:strand:+ start:143 stop:583 length:441 start_codon:yes stop_codon:yes gene_type:complete